MRNRKNLASTAVAAVAAFAIGAFASTGARAVVVDVELQLLVDVSGSISTTEFNLQRSGYVSAFQNAAVQAQIANNPNGVAVELIYWSGSAQQQVAVGWTHLTDAASANAFAAAIGAAARPFSGNTAIQSALNFGAGQFGANGFEGTKLIIDISGDGTDNNSPGALLPTVGRDNALAVVDTINGLVIGGSVTVLNHYTSNVIGGTGAFVTGAANFTAFANAVANKIFRETGGTGDIPEPATLLLFGIGLAGMGYARRRRAA
jgi:hypothetical protein